MRSQYHGYNEFEAPEEEPIWKKYAEQVRRSSTNRRYFEERNCTCYLDESIKKK